MERRQLVRVAELERAFPNLKPGNYGRTSDPTDTYNCIAYAAGDTNRWWDSYSYWPAECVKCSDFNCLFGMFLKALGYAKCENGDLENGVEKVAIFADGRDHWTHAARQLGDGWWVSKLGIDVDITHETPEALEGTSYGRVVLFLKRAITH